MEHTEASRETGLSAIVISYRLSVHRIIPQKGTYVADISIVAANVLPGTDAEVFQGLAGGTLTAGMACYLDATTNRVKAADANASLESAEVKGIALHAASAEQPIRLQTGGTLTIGATVVLATIYILSGTPGGIAPAVDLASGMYTSIVGVAISATALRITVVNARALKA
jgi:hypothetical protein